MQLEIGDYILSIKINGVNNKKNIHNYCNDKRFLFVLCGEMNY